MKKDKHNLKENEIRGVEERKEAKKERNWLWYISCSHNWFREIKKQK